MVLTMLNTNMVFIFKFDPRNITRNAVEYVVFYVFFCHFTDSTSQRPRPSIFLIDAFKREIAHWLTLPRIMQRKMIFAWHNTSTYKSRHQQNRQRSYASLPHFLGGSLADGRCPKYRAHAVSASPACPLPPAPATHYVFELKVM